MQHIRLTQLDGLRGLFSLMLILFHFPTDNEFAGMHLTSNFLVRQADLFVDFFFVLSGFVISFNYESKLGTYKEFGSYLTQRFLRLYPLLFYTVLVFLGFDLCMNLFLSQFVNNPRSISTLLSSTANSLLFLSSTPAFNGQPGMNYPSWSISSEMISYIIFGLGIVLFGKRKKLALGLIMLAAAAFLIYINSYMQAYMWGFVRGLVCFIAGYFTFIAYKRYSTLTISAVWEYLMFALLIVVFYIRYHYIADNDLTTLYIIPAFFAVSIFVYALSNGYIVKLMSGKVFQYLGKISYSIYLNHAIVLIVVTKVAFNVLKLPVTELNVALVLALCIAAVVAYSHVTYTIIERKGRTFLHSLFYKKHDEKQATPNTAA